MRVMVIVKANENSEAGNPPDTEMLNEMGKYNEELINAGIMLEGEGLLPSSTGVRINFSGDQRDVVDGPFAETKELIAGFWIWEVRDMDEAVEWARRCPNPTGEESVLELRPIARLEDFGDEVTPEIRDRDARLRSELEERS
jgi:hypothetical protein